MWGAKRVIGSEGEKGQRAKPNPISALSLMQRLVWNENFWTSPPAFSPLLTLFLLFLHLRFLLLLILLVHLFFLNLFFFPSLPLAT